MTFVSDSNLKLYLKLAARSRFCSLELQDYFNKRTDKHRQTDEKKTKIIVLNYITLIYDPNRYIIYIRLLCTDSQHLQFYYYICTDFIMFNF